MLFRLTCCILLQSCSYFDRLLAIHNYNNIYDQRVLIPNGLLQFRPTDVFISFELLQFIFGAHLLPLNAGMSEEVKRVWPTFVHIFWQARKMPNSRLTQHMFMDRVWPFWA